MSNVNIFEQAVRRKLRFESSIGFLSVEDVYGLDLTAKKSTQVDLNQIAVLADAKLTSLTAKSFVDDGEPTQAKRDAQLALDVVKHIIAIKKAEKAATIKAAADKAELETLTSALEHAQGQALKGMTVEELQAKIQALRQRNAE